MFLGGLKPQIKKTFNWRPKWSKWELMALGIEPLIFRPEDERAFESKILKVEFLQKIIYCLITR